MIDRNDGGPAFPAGEITLHEGSPTEETRIYMGMSLRDYFAGQAIVGVMGRADLADMSSSDVAAFAFFVADAMLAARES